MHNLLLKINIQIMPLRIFTSISKTNHFSTKYFQLTPKKSKYPINKNKLAHGSWIMEKGTILISMNLLSAATVLKSSSISLDTKFCTPSEINTTSFK